MGKNNNVVVLDNEIANKLSQLDKISLKAQSLEKRMYYTFCRLSGCGNFRTNPCRWCREG